ncbi:MAG: hypothetical protein E7L27_12485, partial [Enterococcus faecalis]|nr:hypothetical protein [Enterococcus faecalis]
CSLIFGEFRLISEGVASVPAVYQFLSMEQKSKVIFVPRSSCLFSLNYKKRQKVAVFLLPFGVFYENFQCSTLVIPKRRTFIY